MHGTDGLLGVCPVNREYDLFEVFPDGALVWRGPVSGRDDAIRKLQELSAETGNELRLMHVPTKTLIRVL